MDRRFAVFFFERAAEGVDRGVVQQLGDLGDRKAVVLDQLFCHLQAAVLIVALQGFLGDLVEQVGKITVIVAEDIGKLPKAFDGIDVGVDVIHHLVAKLLALAHGFSGRGRLHGVEIPDDVQKDLLENGAQKPFGEFPRLIDLRKGVAQQELDAIVPQDPLVGIGALPHDLLQGVDQIGGKGIEGVKIVLQRRLGIRGDAVNVAGEGEKDVSVLNFDLLAVGKHAAFSVCGNRQFKPVQVRVGSDHRVLAAVRPADLEQEQIGKANGVLDVIVGNVISGIVLVSSCLSAFFFHVTSSFPFFGFIIPEIRKKVK